MLRCSTARFSSLAKHLPLVNIGQHNIQIERQKDPITFVSYQWKLSNFVYPHMHPNKIASKKNGTENKFNP